jgi:integrase
VIVVAGRCVEAPTKSRQCRRVALDPLTLEVLAEHRARANERATQADTVLGPDAFMFSHDPDANRPWRPDSVSRTFRRLSTQLDLDNVRFHDLRHYVATRLLAGGIDLRTVAGRLGHAKAGTTLNVYAAFVPDADRDAANVMADLLSPRCHHSAGPMRRQSTPANANPAANPEQAPTPVDPPTDR